MLTGCCYKISLVSKHDNSLILVMCVCRFCFPVHMLPYIIYARCKNVHLYFRISIRYLNITPCSVLSLSLDTHVYVYSTSLKVLTTDLDVGYHGTLYLEMQIADSQEL